MKMTPAVTTPADFAHVRRFIDSHIDATFADEMLAALQYDALHLIAAGHDQPQAIARAALGAPGDAEAVNQP